MNNTEYTNAWPMALYMDRESIAPLIDANALIFLWQSFDSNQYFEQQENLVKWGLENNLVKVENGIVVTTDYE
jgi:hypothetical protein